MADVNYLQKVEEGEKIKASVTNSNNNYLDNKIDTNTKNLTDVINGIKTSLQSQIDTNNTNLTNSINSLKTSVNNSISNLKFNYNGSQLGLTGGATTSLSNWLPNDGKTYLIWVYNWLGGRGSEQTTISTDIFPNAVMCQLDGDSGRSSADANVVCVPVGSGRRVYVSRNSTILGYMKVG